MKTYISTILALLFLTPAYGQTSIGPTGIILLEGKPFFPFGCYGIHWENPQAEKMNSLVELGKAGFNIVCMEEVGGAPASDFTKVMDEAQKNNIKILIGAPYAPSMKWRAMARKDHSATFGYNVADDGDNGKFTVGELTTIEAEIKKEDPSHITHLTLTGWSADRRSKSAEFIAISDFSSYQCYPICQTKKGDFTAANSLSETYKRTLAYVLEAEKVKKPFIMLPQTFSWGSKSNAPCYPSVVELRNMVYTGLAAGVKGIISYDFSFDLVNNQKPLWKEYSDLGKDILGNQSYFLEGKLTRHKTGKADLVVSSWQLADTTLFVVANTSYSIATKNITLQLPSRYANPQLKSINQRIALITQMSGNNLKVNLASAEVQVFKMYNAVREHP